jgi:hypothetical protein
MRRPALARAALALALCLLVGIAVLRLLGEGGSSSGAEDAAQRAGVVAPALPPSRFRSAALLALAGDRLRSTPASELGMLEVALENAGVERVIETGADRVNAAIRLEHLILTAGSDDVLRVWRPANGTLVGEVRTPRPLTVIGEASGMPLAAAADASGRLALIDVSDPHHPRLLPLRGRSDRGPALAIGFTEGGDEVLVMRGDGELERLRTSDGRRLGSESLAAAAARLSGVRRPGRLVAAGFASEPSGPPRQLLLGFGGGAVVRVTTMGRHAKLLLAPGVAPGTVTSVAAVPYGGEVAVGASAGLVTLEKPSATPYVQAGPAVAGVAFNLEDELLVAEGEGVARWPDSYSTSGSYGRPALGLSAGHGGILAIDPGGAVSVLGPIGGGLELPTSSDTPAVSFLPGGGLVVAEGWSANHIERLQAVRPGHEDVQGSEVSDPEIRAYEPAPGWWPESEEDEEGEESTGLYVNALASDREFVVAGGQDPTGEAVVLVWDARSGKPLQRLPLATGGLSTNEPSIVAEVVLAPGKHLLAAYSAVQQMVAIWSTESWKLLATIPVGQLGDLSLSPDESALVGVGLPENEEEEGTGKASSKLIFIDTDTMTIDHEVRTEEADRGAFSPDGKSLALLGLDETLRFRSADGRRELRRPIHLDSQPLALAWRPDGAVIAVSLNDIGTVLINPANGAASAALPDESASVFGLDWSPDGRFLAASPATQSETSEAFEPEPAEIWALGAPRLQRRMCQLAGGPASPSEWRDVVDREAPYRSLCRSHSALPRSPKRDEPIVLGSMAFVPNGSGWGGPEPERVFNGGDPSGLITEIHWRSWGGKEAIGFGRTPIFKPRGGYYPGLVQIELRAHALGRCGIQPAYTGLSVRVPRHPGGPLGPWVSWSGARTLCKQL